MKFASWGTIEIIGFQYALSPENTRRDNSAICEHKLRKIHTVWKTWDVKEQSQKESQQGTCIC